MSEKFYETIWGHRILDEKFWSEKLKQYMKAEDIFLLDNIKEKTKLLDIGCGEGRHLKLLVSKCSNLFGIDYSKTMVEKAIQNTTTFPNINVINQDIKNSDFNENSFDYIICMFNTFGNMDYETQKILLKKVEKFLKPEGRFILSIYSENAKDIQAEFYKNIGLFVEKADENFVYTNKFISERFSKERLKEIIEKNSNLKISKIISLNEISYLIEICKVN